MATIKLDPVGIVTIGGREYPAAKGNVRAYSDDTQDGIVFAISALTNFVSYPYTDFVDGDDQPFGSRAAVITYINANFPKASGNGGAVEDLEVAEGKFIVGDAAGKGSTRGVLPSDLSLSLSGSTVPVKDSSTNTWGTNGMRVSTTVVNSTIPFRVSGGRTKTADATETDDSVTLNQFQGILNNTLTNAETSATLNAAYPSIAIGSVVRTITNTTKYIKISATQWQKETITVV